MNTKNNFVTTRVTLGTDVANGGTFTVPYPTGYTAGDFSNAHGHYLSLGGDKLMQPQDITLAFGASSVTVTNNTGSTLPGGKEGYFQFELRGELLPKSTIVGRTQPARVRAAELFGLLIEFGSPKTLDTNGLWNQVAAGATASTGDISTMASTANGGQLDVPRNLTVTGSAGADHAVTFNGFDEYGAALSETITANGTNTVAGKKAFYKVTDYAIAAGGASGDTLDIGWGDVLGLPVRVNSAQEVIEELEGGVVVGGGNVGLVDFYFPIDVADLSTGSAAAPEIVAPFSFVIKQLRSTVRVAISTGGTLTMDVRGGTAVDGLSITVANSATKGTSQTDTPTAGHASTVVAKGDRVQIVPQDAFNGGGALDTVLTVLPTGLRRGTLVTGLDKNTKSTATTADVRGTYTPGVACDGTTSFALKVLTPEPADIGNIQYAA